MGESRSSIEARLIASYGTTSGILEAISSLPFEKKIKERKYFKLDPFKKQNDNSKKQGFSQKTFVYQSKEHNVVSSHEDEKDNSSK